MGEAMQRLNDRIYMYRKACLFRQAHDTTLKKKKKEWEFQIYPQEF